MIIFGSKVGELLSKEVPVACTNCGKSSQSLRVFLKYAHIFWLPSIPLTKLVFIECGACRATLNTKSLKAMHPEFLREAKAEAKIPVWTFAGLAVIACISAYGFWQEAKSARESREYARAPVVGDVAVVKKEGEFRVLKVTAVHQGSITYLSSNYVYKSGFSAQRDSEEKSQNEDYYAPQEFDIDLETYKNSDIYRVIRE